MNGSTLNLSGIKDKNYTFTHLVPGTTYNCEIVSISNSLQSEISQASSYTC